MLSSKYEGKTVTVRGWVYRKRSMKEKIFLVIRDSTDIVQVVINSDSKAWQAAQKITIESSCYVTGKARKDARAPTGYELDVTGLEIVGLAEVFPISRDVSTEFLMDVRHLAIRGRKMQATLKVRSKVFEAIHEFCRAQKFHETHSPFLVPGVAEEGLTMFKVDYYGTKAFLAQTWQLYAEAVLPALEKIYTIAPSFRAEKSRTTRHLTEYWHTEVEAAWYDLDKIIKFAEGLIAHVCQKVGKDCQHELKVLGRDPKVLLAIKAPFPRITYTQALKLLEKDGMKVRWGKDLRTLEERQLMNHYKKPLFVTHYPKEAMAFYKPRDPKDPKTASCFDMLCPELGVELMGGSERDPSIEELKKSLKSKGEKVKDYEFYFDTRRYGAMPHAGFGLGTDRLVQWLCKLEHIRDAIPFPRTPSRIRP